MAALDSDLYVSIPAFAAEASLWHGFGTCSLSWPELTAEADRRGLSVVSLSQQHGDRVIDVPAPPRRPLAGDALVTARPGFLLVIQTADCLPVLLTDPRAGVVAAVHCGWRGTRLRILNSVVRNMVDNLDCRIERLQAALGPCITGSCYEVGQDVRDIFADEGHPPRFFKKIPDRRGKYHFDLQGVNRHHLCEAGLTESQIFSINYCTHCEKSLYSYRRDENEAGRLLNFIGRLS